MALPYESNTETHDPASLVCPNAFRTIEHYHRRTEQTRCAQSLALSKEVSDATRFQSILRDSPSYDTDDGAIDCVRFLPIKLLSDSRTKKHCPAEPRVRCAVETWVRPGPGRHLEIASHTLYKAWICLNYLTRRRRCYSYLRSTAVLTVVNERLLSHSVLDKFVLPPCTSACSVSGSFF